MIASGEIVNDLEPVLDIVFYENDDTLYAEYARIRNGVVENYLPLSYDAFNSIIDKVKNDGIRQEYKFKGLIPNNVVYVKATDNVPYIAWVKKSFKGTIMLGNKKGSFNYPHLLFILKEEELYVFAVKSSKLTKETELFHAPFPNIYSDGRVCLGTMKYSSFVDYFYEKMMENFERAFYSSKFTHTLMGDSYQGKLLISILQEMIDSDKSFSFKDYKKTRLKIKDVIRT